MSDMMEKHERIGQVLSAAFRANTPVMLDWAELGFAIKAETARADRYKAALESIVGQTSDQFYEGVWREVNYTAQAALEDKP